MCGCRIAMPHLSVVIADDRIRFRNFEISTLNVLVNSMSHSRSDHTA